MEPQSGESGQGGAGSAAHVALLLAEGPYLRGDAAQRGQRQVRAIERLSDDLPPICQAFNAAAARDDAPLLREMAPHLLALLDLLSEYRIKRELCGALLETAARLDDDGLRLLAHYGLGNSARRLSSNLDAIRHLEAASGLAAALDQPVQRARILRVLAQCVAHADSVRARSLLDEALELAAAGGDECERALLLNQHGILDFEQGLYGPARERLGAAIALHGRLGNLDGESRSLGNLAMLELRGGNAAAARELFERALALKEQLRDRRGAATCLANLGSVASDLKEFGTARDYYQRGLDLAKQIGDRMLQAALLTNLGMVAREQHDYVLAATLLSVALQLHRELGSRLNQGVTLRFMSIVSMLQGNTAEAVQYLIESLEIYREFGAQREMAIGAGLAGTLLARQGDLSRGSALLQTALLHEERRGFRFESDVRALLDNSLMEIAQTSASSGFTAESVGSLVRSLAGLDLAGLADFALSTLRERFRYSIDDRRSSTWKDIC